MEHRIDWDQYFMMQAALLASRSTCQRLSVGAVVTSGLSLADTMARFQAMIIVWTRAAIYVTVIACGRFMLK